MEVSEPCSVCGNKNLQLVDGYYYCVECGTQDVNFRETVVEQTQLADGTFANVTTKKFTTVKDGIEMSLEWHKWHANNFMLSGVIEELIALGAEPTIKKKALWVWVRYIKHFQVKDDLSKSKLDINDTSKLFECDDDSGNNENSNDEQSKQKKNEKQSKKMGKRAVMESKAIVIIILYIALNLDKSDIQLSHLFRFVKEKRISLYDCMKFVPKEINTKLIQSHGNMHSENPYTHIMVRRETIKFMKILNLGVPIVPDLNKILDNIITELCLPKDIKNLVLSLMQKAPLDYLEISKKSLKDVTYVPFYEGIVMSYVIVAMKMCFGLDDDYELKQCDAVDRINEENDYPRSYKMSMIEDSSDRLFSFREWCGYMQLRKCVLAKHYLPMAMQYGCEPDDFVFMEHVDIKNKQKMDLKDEITQDILNKMPLNNVAAVIPKGEFEWSLTPLSSYTDVIVEYMQDEELKMLLNEDFTQYSLYFENSLMGVSESNKVVNSSIFGTQASRKTDKKMVYVRYCENKNWLKTKPPTAEHITRDDVEKCVDKDSDHGYDSNTEKTSDKIDATDENTNDTITINEEQKQLETIPEECDHKVIFDDEFEKINLEDLKSDCDNVEYLNNDEFNDHGNDEDILDSKCMLEDSKVDMTIHEFINSDQLLSNRIQFNPETFDREETIKELVLAACKDYKIPIPDVYKKPVKRKLPDERGPSEPKKRNTADRDKFRETKEDIDKLIAAYYNDLEQELLKKVSEHVKTVVENIDQSHLNITFEDDVEPEINQPPIEEPTEASVLETSEVDKSDNEDENYLEEKGDPKFDEKVYDNEQLYVKLPNTEDNEDVFKIDADLEQVITKHLSGNYQKPAETVKLSDQIQFEDEPDSDDSDDEVPLSVLKSQRLKQQEKTKDIAKLDALVKTDIEKYNYWTRHYVKKAVFNSANLGQPFDNEIMQNCPKSFNFVINECAAVLDCSVYTLYRLMQNLEQDLF